jgi:3'(2'),5'-bisphosphate nucleotidase
MARLRSLRDAVKGTLMQSTPSDVSELSPLIDAALAGSRVAMQVYGTDFSVAHKVDDSPVSEADLRSEAAIMELLSATMPGVPIIAEEAFAAGSVPAIDGRFLLVDPLDGTKEFISKNGEFTVNVALIEDAVPVLGVVLAPALGLAYAGARGKAWKGALAGDLGSIGEWTSIAVRKVAAHPIAVASRSHMTPATADMLARVRCGEHRSIGSSLKFCLVAEAEADFYPRLGPTMEWDTAAGDAVLRGAGGVTIALDGSPLRYGKANAPKMRPFENPFFLAAGDAALLAQLDIPGPAKAG